MTVKRVLASDDFLTERETILRTALEVYARTMNEESTKALTAYDMLRADPAKAAKQDETFMTTRGLRQAGEIFADSARKAETALRELDEIIESIEESEL